jgi:autotransporter-associated beta strand protein
VKTKRVNRAAVSAAAAVSVAAVLLGGATAASAQDAFVKFYNNPGTGIGGFAPVGTDTFYQANFASNHGFSKWTLTGPTWSASTLVGPTDIQTYAQSTSVLGNGSLPATPAGGQSTIGNLQLNPTSLTITRAGVGDVTYPAGTIAFVIDQPTNVTSNTATRYDLSKVGYFYDLRQIGTPDGAGVNRNSDPNVQWNDVFEPLFTKADIRSVAGYSGTTAPNTSRNFAYSTDGQSVYFVDSTSGSVTGGLWKKTLTQSGTTGLTRVFTPATSMNVEPSVLPTSVRNFGSGTGDQILIQGQSSGGLGYVLDDGTTVSAPQTLLTAKQIQWFRESTSTPNVSSTGVDAAGNVYFVESADDGIIKYDTAGRMVKVFSRAEQVAFDTTNGATGTSTATLLDLKVRDVTYAGPGGPYTVGQLLFSDSTNGIRAPIGVNLFKPGDFDRDNDVDATDIALFKSKLGLRGVVAASVLTASPFTQTNGADMKYDLNMSTTVSGPAAAVVAIDWKDAKILQQHAGLSAGDVDMDFDVDLDDLDAVGDNYNGPNNKLFTEGNLSSVRIAAIDKDTVNYADLVTLAAHWTGPKPTAGDLSSYSPAFIADATRAFGIGTSGLPHRYVAAANGVWSNAANWTNGVPDGVDQQANLLTDPSNDVNLTVDGNFTVGQLNFDHYFDYTLSGSGTIALEVSTGNAQVNAFAASPTISANVELRSDVDVNVAYAGDNLRISGVISGAAGSDLNKVGPGTLTLSGTNTYAGATIVTAGRLQAAKVVALPGYNTGLVSVAPGATLGLNVGGAGEFGPAELAQLNVAFGAGTTYALDTTNSPGGVFVHAGAMAGPQAFLKLGTGTLTLTGDSTYTGGTTISAGTLQIGNGGSAGSITGPIVNNAALILNRSDAALNLSGNISGTGTVTKTGAGTVTLSGANTYTGGTTVSAGMLVLANADATAGRAISVAGGALAQAQASLPKAVTVTTLTTGAGGKFDVTNNSMVVKGMTAAQVQALLASGYNAGAWNGATGITSTTAAASTETSVGYATQAQLGVTEFKGVTGLAASDVIVKYTYAGDVNLDGTVDIGDLGLLAGAWQQTTGKVWFDGDVTYDGAVNIGDLGLLAGNWQKGTAGNPNPPLMTFDEAMAQFSAFEGVVVPEPTGLALLGIAGAGLLGRRRPRQGR